MRTKFTGILLMIFLCLAAEAGDDAVLKLSRVRWDFESGDLQGWTQSGTLARQPTNKSDDRHMGNFNKQGQYFIGTCELTSAGTAYDDDLTGELKSPAFVIDGPALSLLVGGGSNENLYIALCDASTGEKLILARGQDAEAMRRVIWDLSKLDGRTVYFRIVDAAKGGWGHINVDDIRPLTNAEIEAMQRAERERKEAANRKVADLLENVFKAERKVYSGKELHSLGMPLGPIGGGSIYLRGTGELYRWEIFNNMNSTAYIPDQFFAIRAKPAGGEAVMRVLRYYDGKEPGVKDIRFVGEFPIAHLDYIDPELPVKVSIMAFSPFIPTNAKDSALPVILFAFTVANESNAQVEVSLVGAFQNAVGYDGKARYERVSWEGYGGNSNSLRHVQQDKCLVVMSKENSKGGMALFMGGEGGITANPQWADAKAFLDNFRHTGSLGIPMKGLSEKGKTWNAALASTFTLAPGSSRHLGFAILWYFPGRLAVGNMYENWFADVEELASYIAESGERLVRQTILFHDTLFDTTLPYYVIERLSSQMSTPCTQLCMWLKDNSFFGFEGLNPDGTGCCPMNCNHVWNYEQTLARLFPEIERSMRVIDLEHQMEENGAVHHRVAYPLQGKVTGPGAVCDGQASTISKTYREHLMSADNSFMQRMWPKAKKAMEFMIRNWDGPDEDGVMRGKQFNTYDTSISGPNTFTGTQYLAALRAAEEMAKEMGDDAARRYRAIFEKGSKWLSDHLFNGEYFVQEWPQAQPDHDYGLGCHADQLMGQWWANQLNLDYLLPGDQVKSALRSIFKYDFIPDFSQFEYSLGHREFVWGDGAGLICCTWPKGGKPKTVILYAEEVWTGIEYEVAALMIKEGMINEALAIIRTVHDRYTKGRNPWNEIECGDHYARAMSSWSVLLAAQGFRYHGPKGILGFAPNLQQDDFNSFFSTAEGWGSFSQKREGSTQTNLIELKYGTLKLKQLELKPASRRVKQVSLELSGKPFPSEWEIVQGRLVINFPGPLTLKEGDSIKVEMTR